MNPPTDPPPPGDPQPAEGEPIPQKKAQLAVALAFAKASQGLLELHATAMACARVLDETTTTGGRP
jgi:hypothetical protein